MRVAILESIIMPAGHEVEFDRILVNEMKQQGHEPMFFVPEKFPFKVDYGVPVHELQGGEVVTYAGATWYQKLWRSIQREKRRIAWFNSAYELAKQGACDAIIIPTATYQYIKSLLRSKLKYSPVPVHIIFHGINPKEQPKFEKQAKRIQAYKNVKLHVITLRNDFANSGLTNVQLVAPPVFKPVYNESYIIKDKEEPLRIGFFGQFRKEKNLEPFIQAFIHAKFSVPVELVVQGATAKPEDTTLFNSLIEKYKHITNIVFRHENLIGKDWEEALLSVDAIAMPYAAERYRYHWGAMLFTAIGYNKPVLVSPELNPEVLAQFPIGCVIQSLKESDIIHALQELVDLLSTKKAQTEVALKQANEAYSHEALIREVLRGR